MILLRLVSTFTERIFTGEYVMRKNLIFLFTVVLGQMNLFAQIDRDGQMLLGNEWIVDGQPYFKIEIAEDGIYRIPISTLTAAGADITNLNSAELAIFYLGEEIPIYISSESLTEADFIEFYGEQNRSQLDRYLWPDPDQQMLNPYYSLYTDTSAYFLTIGPGEHKRYGALEPSQGVEREWYLATKRVVYKETHYKPSEVVEGVRFSDFAEAEGFSKLPSQFHSEEIEVDHIDLTTGVQANLDLRFTATFAEGHVNELKWNDQLLETYSFDNSPLIIGSHTLSLDQLNETNTIELSGAGAIDRTYIGTISVKYPRKLLFDQGEAFMDISLEGVDNETLKLTHTIGTEMVVLDPKSGYRMSIAKSGAHFLIPTAPTNGPAYKCAIANQIAEISEITSVEFEDLTRSDAEFIIITNTGALGNADENWIENYASYRSTNTNDVPYKTQIVEIQHLVDQFAYGIDKHPYSIKNFVNFISDNWSGAKYIFLIGKTYEYAIDRLKPEIESALPTYGIPGSDNILTSDNRSSIPLIPIGRLSAQSMDDVKVYLEKIQVMEDKLANAPQTIEDREWMKKILHLSGGRGDGEINSLKTNLDNMGEIIASNRLGADLSSFSKLTNDVIDQAVSEAGAEIINNGIIMKTYFGHGGVTTTQFQGLEDPQFLNNEGFYPAMASLGCYTGNVFTTTTSLSEDNILSPKKGASVYLATSGLGYTISLNSFGKDWYKYLGGEMYGESFGNTVRRAIISHDNINSLPIKSLMQQLIFHGDPALNLFRTPGPDFTFDPNSIVRPETITADSSGLQISVDLVNLGQNIEGSIEILIEIEGPDGNIVQTETLFRNLNGHRQAIDIEVPLSEENLGQNRLYITIDPKNQIDELPNPAAEANNNLIINQEQGIIFFATNQRIDAIHPIDFGVINNIDDLRLLISTSNTHVDQLNYIYQIDTTPLFDSPSFVEHAVSSRGGLIEWRPDLDWEMDRTYYWRFSLDSAGRGAYEWRQSSFTYVPDAPSNGWGQHHYYQFLQNDLSGILLNENRQFAHGPIFREVRLVNTIPANGMESSLFFNGNVMSRLFQFPEGLGAYVQLSIFSSNTTRFNGSRTYPNKYGQAGTTDARVYAYPVETTEQRRILFNALKDSIPDNQYVILWTMQMTSGDSFHPENWPEDDFGGGENLFTLLKKQGANEIDDLISGGISKPYCLAFETGAEGIIQESLAPDVNTSANIDNDFVGFISQGSFTSTPIDNAVSFHSIDWSMEALPSDSAFLNILSPSDSGLIQINNLSYEPGISFIDDIESESIHLKFNSVDEMNHTAAQLLNWNVYYDGLPDAAVRFSNEVDEIQTRDISPGTPIKLVYEIENYTSFDMDSLEVRYTFIYDQVVDTLIQILSPLRSKSILKDVIEYRKANNSNIELVVEVNPSQQQKELHYFNNVLRVKFNRQPDIINPILEVHLDEQRMRDLSYTSFDPVFDVFIEDEIINPGDTQINLNNLEFTLLSPTGDHIPVRSDDFILTHTVDGSKIRYKVRYSTPLTDLGIYTLQVNYVDNYNNKAGGLNYSGRFIIDNRNTISDLNIFPNPAITEVNFSFVVQATDPPSEFGIEITDVTGRLIHFIDLTSLINLGNNSINYNWNAIDSRGNVLIPGVYYYNFITDGSILFETDEVTSGALTILR